MFEVQLKSLYKNLWWVKVNWKEGNISQTIKMQQAHSSAGRSLEGLSSLN